MFNNGSNFVIPLNYLKGKFPYPWEKLYNKFPTLRAVQSGASPILSWRGGSGFHFIDPERDTLYWTKNRDLNRPVGF